MRISKYNEKTNELYFFTGLCVSRWRGSNRASILSIYLWRPWATAMDQRCRSTAGPTTFANGLLDVSSLFTTKLKRNWNITREFALTHRILISIANRKRNIWRDNFHTSFLLLPSFRFAVYFSLFFAGEKKLCASSSLHLLSLFICRYVPIPFISLPWNYSGKYDRWAFISSVIFANANINDYSVGIRGGSQKALNGL